MARRWVMGVALAFLLGTAPSARSLQAQDRGATQLNYVNAPLGDVIRSLAVTLGLNVVLSGVPDTRVTFTTPTPVARDQLGVVLESVLESHGLVLVQSGPLARVIPADQAPATGPVHLGKELPTPPPLGLITQIVPLEAIKAEEAVELLKRAAGPLARIEIMPRSNSVLLTDRGTNVARYLELLREVDTRSDGEAGLRTYIYPLKHGSADELAGTLSQLLGVAVVSTGPTPAQALSERSLSGTLDAFRHRELEALETRRSTPLITVAPSPPPERQPADSTAAPESTGFVGQTTIVPNRSTNSLLIRTAPPNYPLLKETIDALDIRPPQVLLEVLIAEIELDNASQFGINWSAVGSDVTTQFGVQDFSDSALARAEDFAVRAVSLGSVDVRGLLRALSSKSNVRVLSSPHILALNNQEARILVGSEVPFSQSTRTGLTEVVDRIVQFRKVGTQLTIIPTINQDGYVSFRMLQEVSALTTQTLEAALNAPIITIREAETSAVVQDGSTVVIGGLIGESHEVVESGVPFLKDIPILGFAFKNHSNRNTRTELAIFVTPKVVFTDEDAARVLEEERARIHVTPADTLIRPAPR